MSVLQAPVCRLFETGNRFYVRRCCRQGRSQVRTARFYNKYRFWNNNDKWKREPLLFYFFHWHCLRTFFV